MLSVVIMFPKTVHYERGRRMYNLKTLVWELTMGCNLRCRHCGSGCRERLEDELTTEESLKLVDDIALLRPEWVSLTGGEPFLRNDWDQITVRFKEHGIGVRIITNGTLINPEVMKRIKESHCDMISISIDGTKNTHNEMRNTQCYEKCIESLTMLRNAEIDTGVNTTIVAANIDDLSSLRDILVHHGVKAWQIQPGLPVGNMEHDLSSVIRADDINKLIDFSLEENEKGSIQVFLAESIGYYTRNEMLSRKIALKSKGMPIWKGCNAGIRSMGILHNGDIIGCTSIRDKAYIEGNIRNKNITDIWNDPSSFAWRRQMTTTQLAGFCKTCYYSELCLGGCSNTRLTMQGNLFRENPLCVYRYDQQAFEATLT